MFEKIKPAVVLLAVTLLAALALGMVYDVTKEPIAAQKAKNEAETIMKMIPSTEETAAEDVADDASLVTRTVTCFAGGTVVGYVITAVPKGYAGDIELMVGFDTTGVIQGVHIISHSETAGLGANAVLPAFTDQYKGQSGSLTVTKISGSLKPGEVEAITSATITSNAVTRGVNAASAYFEEHFR